MIESTGSRLRSPIPRDTVFLGLGPNIIVLLSARAGGPEART